MALSKNQLTKLRHVVTDPDLLQFCSIDTLPADMKKLALNTMNYSDSMSNFSSQMSGGADRSEMSSLADSASEMNTNDLIEMVKDLNTDDINTSMIDTSVANHILGGSMDSESSYDSSDATDSIIEGGEVPSINTNDIDTSLVNSVLDEIPTEDLLTGGDATESLFSNALTQLPEESLFTTDISLLSTNL